MISSGHYLQLIRLFNIVPAPMLLSARSGSSSKRSSTRLCTRSSRLNSIRREFPAPQLSLAYVSISPPSAPSRFCSPSTLKRYGCVCPSSSTAPASSLMYALGHGASRATAPLLYRRWRQRRTHDCGMMRAAHILSTPSGHAGLWLIRTTR